MAAAYKLRLGKASPVDFPDITNMNSNPKFKPGKPWQKQIYSLYENRNKRGKKEHTAGIIDTKHIKAARERLDKDEKEKNKMRCSS